ncbi:hypothetical protein L9F63_005150, partial [Diploptera punctata]
IVSCVICSLSPACLSMYELNLTLVFQLLELLQLLMSDSVANNRHGIQPGCQL